MLSLQSLFAAWQSCYSCYSSSVSRQPGFGKLNLLLLVCRFWLWCSILVEEEEEREVLPAAAHMGSS